MNRTTQNNSSEASDSTVSHVKPLSKLVGQEFTFVFREISEKFDGFFQDAAARATCMYLAGILHDCGHARYTPHKELSCYEAHASIVEEIEEYFARLRRRYRRIDDEWKKNKRYIICYDLANSSSFIPSKFNIDSSIIPEGEHRLESLYVVAELENNDVNLRFYQATFIFNSSVQSPPSTSDKGSTIHTYSLVAISKDSLSHFQNMRLPPKIVSTLSNNASDATFKGSGGGRPTDLSHTRKHSKNSRGNTKCKTYSKKLSGYTKSALNFWRKLLQKSVRQLEYFCRNCRNSSNQAQTWQKKHCQYSTIYTNASLNNNTPKQWVGSLFFSYYSRLSQETNSWNLSRWCN